MLKRISFKIRNFYNECKITFYQFKNQPAYEIRSVTVCQKTGQHLIEVKITGKGQVAAIFAKKLKYSPQQFVRLCLQDLVNRDGLKLKIDVQNAA